MWCVRSRSMYFILVWTRWWFLYSLQFCSSISLCLSHTFLRSSSPLLLSHSRSDSDSQSHHHPPSLQSSFSFSNTLNNTYDRRVHFLIIYANFHAFRSLRFFQRARSFVRSLSRCGPRIGVYWVSARERQQSFYMHIFIHIVNTDRRKTVAQ